MAEICIDKYSDFSAERHFESYVLKRFPDFCTKMLGVLVDERRIAVRNGHGSPSIDMRFGDVPYIAWALDLPQVKAQWERIIFMQTNREDVGDRYLEIKIPVPPSREAAERASAHYKHYYSTLAQLRSEFRTAQKEDLSDL